MTNIIIISLLGIIVATYFYTYPHGSKQLIKLYFHKNISGPMAISFLLGLIYQAFSQPIFPLPDSSGLLWFIGLIFSFAGLLIFFLGKIYLGSSWGMPAGHDIKKQTRLITGGIYRYTRNPIYVGLNLFYVGCELLLNSYLFLLVIPSILIIHSKVLKEEKLLSKYFPHDYPDYFQQTPRYFKF